MKHRSPRIRGSGLGLSAALLLAWAAPAWAQVRVEVTAPSFRFEVRPPLVVVSPGIEVVPEHDHEVFLVGGVWWSRHDGHWYRARRHDDDRWVRVASSGVPVRLRELPRGKYKHWKVHKAEAKAREKRAKERDKAWEKREKKRRKAAKKRGGHGGPSRHGKNGKGK